MAREYARGVKWLRNARENNENDIARKVRRRVIWQEKHRGNKMAQKCKRSEIENCKRKTTWQGNHMVRKIKQKIT